MLETVVVGAGHAGLSVSWYLRERGIDHLVLEAGQVGESWRSGRWESFAINTPNWAMRLPGDPVDAGSREAFLLRDAWVDRLHEYVIRYDLPVRTDTRVTTLGRPPDAKAFQLRVDGDAAPVPTIEARSVVLAAGFQRVAVMPALAAGMPPGITSLHAGEYRRPDLLPPGAVLVVGSGQSGGQITEDLLDAGRSVFLSASAVPRCPRRYRGRDIFEWLMVSGMLDTQPDQLPDPRLRFAKQPSLSGVGPLGHSISLQWLAARGARLLGRLGGVVGRTLWFAPDLADSVRFGDRVSAEIRQLVDQAIDRNGIPAPPVEADPGDDPEPEPQRFTAPEVLDLDAAGVTTVIWATGFGADLSWVDLPWAGADGAPLHDGGRSPIDGLWYVGLPWMRTRKSALVVGAGDDAAAVVGELETWLRRR